MIRSLFDSYLPLAVSFCFCSRGGFFPADSSGVPFCDGVLGPPALKISLRDTLPDLLLVALPSLDLLVYLSPVFGAFFTSADFSTGSALAAGGLLPKSGPILLLFRILSNFSWMYFYSASSSWLLAPNYMFENLFVN